MSNIRRIEDILMVMNDCITKLDDFNDAYKRVDDVSIKLYMEEGFRGYIRAFQEQLLKYLSHLSRGLYDRKDKLGYKDKLNKHRSAGQLNNVSIDFLLELRKSRNYVAHGYEHPDFQVIYDFYKKYRLEFENIIECVRNTISQSYKISNEDSRKSLDDMYTSLDVAKKLLDVLDDDVIAEKTGIDIEIIKSLRKNNN